MSKISSPLGSRSVSAGANLRHFSVDDSQVEETSVAEAAEVRRKAAEAATLRERQETVKKVTSLEYVLGIARSTVDVDVGDVVFTLKSPKAKEQARISVLFNSLVRKAKAEEALEEDLYDYRLACLTYGLSKIDGMDVGVFLNRPDLGEQDLLEAKQALIEELDEGLVTHMFSKYENMVSEHQAKFLTLSEKGAEEVISSVNKSR
jgi:hypothetical protein